MTIRYDQTGHAMRLSAAIHDAGYKLVDFCLQESFDVGTYQNQLARVIGTLQCEHDAAARSIASIRARIPGWTPSISLTVAIADAEDFVLSAVRFTETMEPDSGPEDICTELRGLGLKMAARDHAERVSTRIAEIAGRLVIGQTEIPGVVVGRRFEVDHGAH